MSFVERNKAKVGWNTEQRLTLKTWNVDWRHCVRWIPNSEGRTNKIVLLASEVHKRRLLLAQTTVPGDVFEILSQFAFSQDPRRKNFRPSSANKYLSADPSNREIVRTWIEEDPPCPIFDFELFSLNMHHH